jgi:alginate O-acetyltransferase complex protein AlgI
VNFNSLEFLVVLLPITFVTFYVVPMRLRLWVLVVASFVFYGASGPEVLLAFLIAILWGYGTAFLFGRWPRSGAIAVAISVPALLLIMFKYLGFILDTVHAQPETRDHFWLFFSIVLPAGISFYTFEIVSYSLDVADKKIEPERDLLRFTSFASFFPHLIAGPIMRYADLRQQLQALQSTQVLKPNIVSGLKLLSIGLAFKIFVADFSGTRVAKASDLPLDQLSGIDQLTQVAFWSSQIYYDFWAYSVMAIGLGRLFCIELPVNFREPYLSRDPREFWQRWHVTLSYWLRDYVYIRMGGRESYVRNILIVFALVGLWHGAGWNFVAWGLYHALLVILYHVTAPAWDRLPRPIAIGMTFTLVSFGWPLFFLSLEKYAAFLGHLATVAPWHTSLYRVYDWLYLAAIGVVTFGLRERNWLYNEPGSHNHNPVTDSSVVTAFLMFVGLLFISLSRTFIYFRF